MTVSGAWKGGEECGNPCSGQKCDEVAKMMNHLIDFTVDPCHDFFAFSCSAKTRGQKPPIARARIEDFKSLVMEPPDGFEYIKKFFTSCIQIQTERTTQEVFFNCIEGDGKCTEEKAAEYGDIYSQFFNHTKRFVNKTAFPAAVTPDWWEARGRVWFGDEGWTWWDFSADILKGYYFLAAFDVEDKTWNKRDKTWDKWDKFRTNLFFAPLIDSVAEKPNEFGSRHSIYLVPITIPHAIKTGNREYFEQYRHLLTGLISSFGEHTDQIEEDVERIIVMEKELGNITQGLGSDEVWWTHREFTESITIRDLSHLIPSVPWKDYIEKTFSENPNFKLQGSTKIWIPQRTILMEIAEYVDKLSTRDQANLLIWRMFSRFANDFMVTGAGEHDIQDDLFSSFAASETREDNCMAQIKTFFPEAEDDMIIGKYIDRSTKDSIREMFDSIAEEFKTIINEQDWMSRRTKSRARKKVEAMGINVGELSPNTEEFTELKGRMTEDDYIENILAIGNYRFDSLVKLVDTEIVERTGSELEWNAYYHAERNEMKILTGLVQGFLGIGLDFNIPPALLYGGFRTLGHEMLHGFDEKGKNFDKDGFRANWWRKNETDGYQERVQCLVRLTLQCLYSVFFKVDQYQTFGISFEGKDYRKEDVFPSGENIADNGGVGAVYRAYDQLPLEEKQCVPGFNFTSDQLFWVRSNFGPTLDDCVFSAGLLFLLLHNARGPRKENTLSRRIE